MRKDLTLALAALLASASPVCAQGFYISGGAGASFLENADNTNDDPVVDVKSSYNAGWIISGAVGYGFANGLRLEGELGYRRVHIDQLKIKEDGGLGATLGAPSFNGLTTVADGKENALSMMVNAWFDIRTGTPFTPYIGGGIGAARVSLDKLRVAGVTIADDHDTVFAYQLGTGLAYALTPKVSLTLDYRFFKTNDAKFTDISGDFKSEYNNHSVLAGVRIGF